MPEMGILQPVFYHRCPKLTLQGASIKPGTRNIPEHSGTCRNIPEHEKMKIIFMKKKNNNNNKIILIKINNNVK